jgi:uncharacterized phage protein gp47/JayE
VFETERAITALRARLASVQVFEGGSYQDVSAYNDKPGQGYESFGPNATRESALMFGFDDKEEFPPGLQFNLRVCATEDSRRPNPCECGLPGTREYSNVQISWEFWNGSEWRDMNLLKDETNNFTRSGYIYLKSPLKGEMKKQAIGEIKEHRYWIQAKLVSGSYQQAPKLLAVRTNTVTATQAESVQNEVLGGASGMPGQTYKVENVPVIADTLKLEILEEDGKSHKWTWVDDFYGSSPDDRHYTLNRTTGEIKFGDGKYGRIPVATVENPNANIIAREYRFGGGKRGNLAAGKIKTLLTSITGIDENEVTNLLESHSGRDEETVKEAALRAPLVLKSKCRAVTAEDFEVLAKQAATIKRAKVLPLHHPKFPGVKVPGVVTVIVVPESDRPDPSPNEGTLRTVCDYLNLRRLLTTELYVVGPEYIKVEIAVEIIVKDDADLATVKTAAENALLDYFHPLKGGDDNQGWEFGGDIYFSKVYQRIFAIQGVRYIEQLEIVIDGEKAKECQDVRIPAGALVYSTEHRVNVRYSYEE